MSQITYGGSKKFQLSHSASLVRYSESGLLLRVTEDGKGENNPALQTPPCLMLISHKESLAEGARQPQINGSSGRAME